MNKPMLNRRRFLLTSAATAAATPALSLAQQSHQPENLPPAIAALTSRRAEAIPITLAEREQRLDRARALMRQNKIDAIVIATGTSLNYFTGLRWGQSERFFAWTLPAKGTPFIVCPVFEEARVRERMDPKPPPLPSPPTTPISPYTEHKHPSTLLLNPLK